MVDASLLELMGLSFFQRALLGGAVAAVATALVGVIVLLRKEAMIGHGIAHVSFGGVAIGEYLAVHQLFFGDRDAFPLLTALLVSVVATLSITFLRRRGIAESDAAIALVTAMGFALGLIVLSLAGGFSVDLFSYLFGNVLTISPGELAMAGALGALIIAFLAVFRKELLAITFDEESARLSGLPVTGLTMAFDLLLALTIVLAIKIIGIILVSALLAIPAVSALQLRLSFTGTMLAAALLSVASVVLGIALSAMYDVATSGLIVVVSVLLLGLVVLYRRMGDETRRPEPAPNVAPP